MISAQDFAETLELEVLVPSTVKAWDLKTTDLNRPGLQFTGYFDYFAYERPQVIGKTEMAYLPRWSPTSSANGWRATSPIPSPAS